MTWTYSNSPATVARDAVRLLCGDTDTTDQLVTDEEIAYFLSLESNDNQMSAARACEAIAAKYARQADKAVGDLRVSASQKSKAYRDQAATLRSQSARIVTPFAGGISVTSKQGYEADADRVAPAFFRDLHGNPDAVRPSADTNSLSE